MKQLFGLLSILFGWILLGWIGYNLFFEMTDLFREQIRSRSPLFFILKILIGLLTSYHFISYGRKWIIEETEEKTTDEASPDLLSDRDEEV